MSNLNKILNEKITLIAKRHARDAAAPNRKSAAAAKQTIVDLKKRVAVLETTLGDLVARLSRCEAVNPVFSKTNEKVRITAKGMRSLRKKLRLTGEEFGKLLGVSTVTVYQWERKNGPLRVRDATRSAILEIRDLGAREAKQQLVDLALAKKFKKS